MTLSMKSKCGHPLFRGFCCSALLLTVVVVATGETSKTSSAIRLNHLPLLFADDSGVESTRGVTRTLHPARRREAPVVISDRSWEGGRVYTYGSVHFDPEAQLFRLWYMSRSQFPGPKPAPQLRAEGQDLVLYATSTDGATWTKPELRLREYRGSTANNIVADFHTPSVWVDSDEKDPGKKFKMLAYSKGNYFSVYSADGVHWSESAKNPVFQGDDTMTLTRDPKSGDYLAYFKKKGGPVPGRTVWLTRSQDFETWSEPKLVFHADAEDDRWAREPGQRTEVYNMAVFPHAAGFLGMPTLFRIMSRMPDDRKPPIGQSPHDGPIDVNLVTSVDGETWVRSSPRVNIIQRGAPGTYDGGAILGVANTLIDHGEESWVYYTAINTGHGGAIPPKVLTIGRAEWRRHGFASFDAGPDGGIIETKPLLIGGGRLMINADASRGSLRVALLEVDGRPIPGFTAEDFQILKIDATQARATWREDLKVPSDRPVRVRIEMNNCRLFSLAADVTGQ